MKRSTTGKHFQIAKLHVLTNVFIALQFFTVLRTSDAFAATKQSNLFLSPIRNGGRLQHASLPQLSRLFVSSNKSSEAIESQETTKKTRSKSAADSQNAFGVVSDAATGLIFSFLHAFDDCGIKDSSKNLRVLWVRALLNYRNQIDDPVAQELLPKTTRGLVTSEWGASMLDPILKFAEWIQARTEFIDESLDNFLSSPACKDAETTDDLGCNVVLFGAGYDTRALRFRHEHSGKINFIEVDLPDVVEGKKKLYKKFQEDNDPEWKNTINFVPLNLNDCGGESPTSLIDTLRDKGGELTFFACFSFDFLSSIKLFSLTLLLYYLLFLFRPSKQRTNSHGLGSR